MKTLIRTFGLTLFFILMCAFLMQSLSHAVRYNEINSILTSAMTSTQIVAQENIKDRRNNTNYATTLIRNNQDYLLDFKRNLNKLKSSDTNYSIYVYGVDYEKGLLDIEIRAKLPTLKGGKTIIVRKTSIVDILI